MSVSNVYNLEDFRNVASLAESYYRILVANAMTVMAEEEFQEFKQMLENCSTVH